MLHTYLERPYDGLTGVLGRILDRAEPLKHRDPAPSKVLVPGMPFMYEARLRSRDTNICYTTFETTRLPHPWVEALNRSYRACIVPHPSVRRTFAASGVSVPIEVVPQGFTRHPRSPAKRDGRFRVGFLGVPQKRKNLAALFAACRDLTGPIPGLRLAVHVSTYYSELDPGRFDEMRSAPFVEWTEGKLTEDRIAEWYSNLSVYVFPSSGEGWSFTPRESLYLGIPTVISDIPVHRELAESGFCRTIPSRGLVPAVHEFREKGNVRTETFGEWHDITTEDIRHAILDVHDRQAHFAERATRGAEWIRSMWRNEDCLDQLQAVISAIRA